MWSFLAGIWASIAGFAAALVPFKPGQPLSPVVRWTAWILLDLIALLLLALLNYRMEFFREVDLPRLLSQQAGWLKYCWLPILGQLLIFIGIVLYWLYALGLTPEEGSPFPEIDEAWHEAMTALEQAGIRLPKLPLFLVLGRPASAEQNVFDASAMKLVVKQTPADPKAPIHVFADHDAVYITCRGASLLGKLAGILAMENLPASGTANPTDADVDLDATSLPGRKEQGILDMLRAAAGQENTATRKRALRRAAIGKSLGADLLSDIKEVAWCRARLAHLCRLILRERQPFCGANGILMLVPLAGTDTSEEAQLTAQASVEDLSVVRQEMKLDCPLIHLLVDMEDLSGFADFVQRQSAKELGNRRGNGFPLATRLPRIEVLNQIRTSLIWVCTTYLQDSVYPVFKMDPVKDPRASAFSPGNARLMLLLDEMNERADSLALIVQHAVGPSNEALFRYGGCYFAATGARGSQAFVAGVFQKLLREQSSVSWTEAALVEDAHAHKWAGYYTILSGAGLIAWLTLFSVVLYRAWTAS